MKPPNAQNWIDNLQLKPHPEGGHYREEFLSEKRFEQKENGTFPSGRRFFSCICYLLEKNEFSAFHKLKSDETWHHIDGGAAEISLLTSSGIEVWLLGKNLSHNEAPLQLIPANTWFTVAPSPKTEFSLCSCSMSPGFDFKDFELAQFKNIVEEFKEFDWFDKEKDFLKERCLR